MRRSGRRRGKQYPCSTASSLRARKSAVSFKWKPQAASCCCPQRPWRSPEINSTGSASYEGFWTGAPRLMVNDGLMSLFFLLVKALDPPRAQRRRAQRPPPRARPVDGRRRRRRHPRTQFISIASAPDLRLAGGPFQRRPTLHSRSVCSHCWAIACPRLSEFYCLLSRSSTISPRCS